VVIRGRRRHSSTSFPPSVHLLSYRGGQQISLPREKFSRPNCKKKICVYTTLLKEITSFA
jgi:hypothetical protein